MTVRGRDCAMLFGFTRGHPDLGAVRVGVVSFASDCKTFVSPRTGVTFAYASVEVNADWFAAAI